MMGYIESLDNLGFSMSDELAMNVILYSVPRSFHIFIMNFHVHEQEEEDSP